MTTHNEKVCRDCGEVYWFQASGGNAPLNNDSIWCVSCAELINNVRKQIKRKFDWKWVISNEYTIDELKELELSYDTKQLLEHEEKLKQNIYTFPLTRRVFPSMFNLNDPSDSNIIRQVITEKGVFLYSVWTKRPDVEIKKKVYWDLVNNEMAKNQPRSQN